MSLGNLKIASLLLAAADLILPPTSPENPCMSPSLLAEFKVLNPGKVINNSSK